MNSGPKCIPRLFELLVDTQALEAESGADGSTPLQNTAV